MRTRWDLIAVGETLGQFVVADGRSLDEARDFALGIAGAESNVAVAFAQLGGSAAWAGRVGDDPVGRRVLGTLSDRGVDVSMAVVDPIRPTGIFLKAVAGERREISYFRAHSAGSGLSVEDAAAVLTASPRLVHVTGITPALSASAAAASRHLLASRTTITSFDVNHRAQLWTRPAGDELAGLARAADVVFVGLDEATALWGAASAAEVRTLLADVPYLVVKNGSRPAVEFSPDGVVEVAAIPADPVDAVGAGDAFAAGWLKGLLDGRDGPARLRLGHLVAHSVLASTGDHAQVNADLVDNIRSEMT